MKCNWQFYSPKFLASRNFGVKLIDSCYKFDGECVQVSKNPAQMENQGTSIIETVYGGEGGKAFNMVVPRSLAIRSGEELDQITINESSHGGNGGGPSDTIFFQQDEYISDFTISYGVERPVVMYVNFQTNKGNTIAAKHVNGISRTVTGARVIGIGGRSGDRVDKLRIRYISNYKPSQKIKEDVGFILSFTPPFTQFTTYEDSKYSTIDSYEKTTESNLKQNYSASVEGEYYVKVTASASVTIEDCSTQNVKKQLTNELEKGKKTIVTIEKGYVGVTLVSGTVMQDGENQDTCWVYPTSLPSYAIIEIDRFESMLEHYDLTGELHTQMPALIPHKTIRNGFIYYEKKASAWNFI